jgi:hypothetical protein
MQWIAEIRKVTGDALVVDFFDHKQAAFLRQSSNTDDMVDELDERPADIVVTTYQALEKKGKKNPGMQILTSKVWGRVVLDEMQEIRSWTTSISKHCQCLQSDRRWMLSGTPLLEGIQDFRGELCFLGLEPFAANNEDGYFDFAISNHWNTRSNYGLEILRVLSLVMLRRSKSMTIRKTNLPLLGLKPLTLTFEPVPQDTSERALYCFLEYLMHSTMRNDNNELGDGERNLDIKLQRKKVAFLRLLRELCISPFLLNGGLGCSSQLGTLNNLMKDFNRRQHHLEEHASDPTTRISGGKIYSCDEAIRFLSQVEDTARTEVGFVTDLRLGGGGGVSRRDRAFLEDPKQLYKEAKTKLETAERACEAARTKRARALWPCGTEHWNMSPLGDWLVTSTRTSRLVYVNFGSGDRMLLLCGVRMIEQIRQRRSPEDGAQQLVSSACAVGKRTMLPCCVLWIRLSCRRRSPEDGAQRLLFSAWAMST